MVIQIILIYCIYINLFSSYRGYVLENNKHDCMYVQIGIDENDEYYKEKKENLQIFGIATRNASFCIKYTDIPIHFKYYFGVKYELDADKQEEFYPELLKWFEPIKSRFILTIEEEKELLSKTTDKYMREIIKYRIAEKNTMKEFEDFLTRSIKEYNTTTNNY